MKTVLKFRWFVIALWLVVALSLVFTVPSLAGLVREKGQITVPPQYTSALAEQLLAEKSGSGNAVSSTALVFHHDGGLTADDEEKVKSAIQMLESEKDSIGIRSITTHLENADLADQMLSSDKSTMIVLVDIELADKDVDVVREALYNTIASIEVEHYYTGDWLIGQDVILSSEQGLKRTEIITVVFILIVLLLVFRSAVAPFVPMLTVGLSYFVAQSVVAWLAANSDFPLSTFTQIFMIAIMFGIGTDYCILLISRYKEELSKSGDKLQSILTTYQTAGKTVFVSGIAVLIGFSAIGLSEFILYRSAIAVAVGIAVMMIALYTVVPFFLYVLGNKLFWPAKGKLEHGPNKLWDKVGAFSLKRPVVAILIVAIIVVPLYVTKKDLVSYNNLDEIGDSFDSVKGFNLIESKFGAGEAMPTTVVIKSDQPFNTPEGMAWIERTSRAIIEQDGVATVRSATRPLGEPLEDFFVTDQVSMLEEGLVQGQEGLLEIKDGLAEAEQALTEHTPQLKEAVDGAEQLVSGTKQLQAGVDQLSTGLQKLSEGMKQGTKSSEELRLGLVELEANAKQLASAGEQLSDNYGMMLSSSQRLLEGYGQIYEQQSQLAVGLSSASQAIASLQQAHPQLATDETYLTLVATIDQLSQGQAALAQGINELNQGLSGLIAGFTQANAGLVEASNGQQAFAQAMSQVTSGIGALRSGLEELTAGIVSGSSQVPKISEGLNGIADGGTQLQQGFVDIQQQLSQLTDGLAASVDGLAQVTDGFSSAEEYVSGLVQSPDKQLAGWYMPQEAIESADFATVLEQYMSADHQILTFDVVMEANPYSAEALQVIEPLISIIDSQLVGTPFETAQFELGGVTSMNNDLKLVSGEDYNRTVTFMMIGIFIILVLLFRSIVIPIYIVISLLITYSTSLAVTELIFVKIFGLTGVSWAVPFFGCVMLIALGVDYSIFLMDRFRENKHMEPSVAIHEAMKSMGSVIMSAAIILGGTFAAMLPSGVMSLLQIAVLVLTGLFLYALIMLPLFIPVVVKLLGKYNWWPFTKRQ